MVSMHKLVEVEGGYLPAGPAIEFAPKVAEGRAKPAFMSDDGPLSHQAFDPFGCFLHCEPPRA